MKKAVTYLFLAALVFTTTFTSNKKKIIGTWVLSSVKITDIDELIKRQLDESNKIFNQLLFEIEDKIEETEDEAEKASLEEQKKQYEKFKTELTPDILKTQIKEQFKTITGKFTITFYENKTFKSTTENNKTKGTWLISNNGKTITTKDKVKEEEITIIKISNNKLIFEIIRGINASKFTIQMTFSRTLN